MEISESQLDPMTYYTQNGVGTYEDVCVCMHEKML